MFECPLFCCLNLKGRTSRAIARVYHFLSWSTVMDIQVIVWMGPTRECQLDINTNGFFFSPYMVVTVSYINYLPVGFFLTIFVLMKFSNCVRWSRLLFWRNVNPENRCFETLINNGVIEFSLKHLLSGYTHTFSSFKYTFLKCHTFKTVIKSLTIVLIGIDTEFVIGKFKPY